MNRIEPNTRKFLSHDKGQLFGTNYNHKSLLWGSSNNHKHTGSVERLYIDRGWGIVIEHKSTDHCLLLPLPTATTWGKMWIFGIIFLGKKSPHNHYLPKIATKMSNFPWSITRHPRQIQFHKTSQIYTMAGLTGLRRHNGGTQHQNKTHWYSIQNSHKSDTFHFTEAQIVTNLIKILARVHRNHFENEATKYVTRWGKKFDLAAELMVDTHVTNCICTILDILILYLFAVFGLFLSLHLSWNWICQIHFVT